MCSFYSYGSLKEGKLYAAYQVVGSIDFDLYKTD